MDKNDKSLEEADILKILIYSFVFIAVCAVLILFLVIPFLKDYKTQYTRLNQQQIHNARALNELNAIEDSLKKFQKENSKKITQINAEFSHEEFMKFMKNYFEDIKINLVPINKTEDYLKYQFNVQASMQSPQAFYSFLNDLQNYTNLVEVTTPIEFKSREKYIDFKFKIKVFYAKAIQK